jgi:iron complex transport system ATP-binding protein
VNGLGGRQAEQRHAPGHAGAEPPPPEGEPSRPVLSAEGLRLAYEGRTVVDRLDVAVPAGRVTAVVGPNACGKSTLLRALGRLLPPRAGTVHLDGHDIATVPTKALATRLGLLPQGPQAPDGITVAELVARGRHPHRRWYRPWSADDEEAVAAALTATGTTDLAHRPVDELSGGQRQRVWIALTLAQGTDVLLLDEPTTYLDVAHQLDVLDLLVELNRDEGRTVVLVLHDLNQALRYADHLVALRAGAVVAQGPPATVVTEALVAEVFGVTARVIPDPVTGGPLVVPVGRHHRPSPGVP